MDRYEANKLALELMTKHGLMDQGWHFDWNKRRRAAGLCSYRKKNIQLSLPLTLHSSVEDVTDTILHEIAHALAGSDAGHGPKWVAIAKSIGCNGLRCYGSEKPSTLEAFKKVAKYKGVCPNGHEVFRNRLPKRKGSCSRCSSRFNPDFLMVYSRNV